MFHKIRPRRTAELFAAAVVATRSHDRDEWERELEAIVRFCEATRSEDMRRVMMEHVYGVKLSVRRLHEQAVEFLEASQALSRDIRWMFAELEQTPRLSVNRWQCKQESRDEARLE